MKLQNRLRRAKTFLCAPVIYGLLAGTFWSLTSISLIYILFSFLNVSAPSNISNTIISITVPSIVTIAALFSSIFTLSFNLGDRLPANIVKKHILRSKETWQYLGIQGGLIFGLTVVLMSGQYNKYWSITFLWALLASVTTTGIFFKIFLDRASKSGIYDLLKGSKTPEIKQNKIIENLDDSVWEDKGSYYEINGEKDVEDVTPTSDIGRMRLPSDKTGIVRVDENRLSDLFDNEFIENLYTLKLAKDGYPVSSSGSPLSEVILSAQFESSAEAKVKQKLKNSVWIEEIDWYEDWSECMQHSVRTSPEDLNEDFKFLSNELKQKLNENEKVFKLVLEDLSEKFSDSNEANRKVIEKTIRTVYELKHIFSKKPILVKDIVEALQKIGSEYGTNIEHYSPRYSTLVLYISEQIRTPFRKDFEEEKDKQRIKEYGTSIKASVESAADLIETTIEISDRNPDISRKHLKSQLDDYTSILQGYKSDKTRIEPLYYTLSEEEKEIIDLKCDIVEMCEELQERKLVYLAIKLSYYIDEDKVSQSFSGLNFDLIEEVMEENQIYEHTPSTHFLGLRNQLGINRTPPSKFRYIAIYLIHKEIEGESGNYPSSKSDKEALRKQINALTYREATDWFDISKPEFIRAKNQIKKNI